MQKAITYKELEKYLTNLLQAQVFEERAYNGVQVMNATPITRVATAVSATLETINAAREAQAQALVVHHGIFLENDDHPLVGRLYDKVRLLIEQNCALLCYHLPLDAHQELGNNWKAALDLGLRNCQPFLAYNGQYIGVIGEIVMSSFDAFKEQVEQYYGRPAQAVKVRDAIVRVAIVSGGADRFVKDAALAGADCYITGRVDEPVWDDAHEYGISFLGLGHYGTETVGPKALAQKIEEHFGVSSVFLQTDNPF